jgi:hypothetical protein
MWNFSVRLRNVSLARLRWNAPPNIRLVIDNQNLVHKTRFVVAPSLEGKPACGHGNPLAPASLKPASTALQSNLEGPKRTQFWLRFDKRSQVSKWHIWTPNTLSLKPIHTLQHSEKLASFGRIKYTGRTPLFTLSGVEGPALFILSLSKGTCRTGPDRAIPPPFWRLARLWWGDRPGLPRLRGRGCRPPPEMQGRRSLSKN